MHTHSRRSYKWDSYQQRLLDCKQCAQSERRAWAGRITSAWKQEMMCTTHECTQQVRWILVVWASQTDAGTVTSLQYVCIKTHMRLWRPLSNAHIWNIITHADIVKSALTAEISWKAVRVWTRELIITELSCWSKGQGPAQLINTSCTNAVDTSKLIHLLYCMCILLVRLSRFWAICLVWSTMKVTENISYAGEADRRPLEKSRQANRCAFWLAEGIWDTHRGCAVWFAYYSWASGRLCNSHIFLVSQSEFLIWHWALPPVSVKAV